MNPDSLNYKILVIDDEQDQLNRIKEIIDASNSLKKFIKTMETILVDPERGPIEVVEQIKKQPAKWNVILSDLFMPTPEKGGLMIADALIPFFEVDNKFPVNLIFISNKVGAGAKLREYYPKYKWIAWYPKPKINRDDFNRCDLAQAGIWTHAIAKAIMMLNQKNYEVQRLIINIEELEIGLSAQMKIVQALADKAAERSYNILILGETGSGKEILAKYIHQKSNRANEPFLAINCAAIPEDLMPSELFGHEKGAFTGAIKEQVGKLESVGNGTIFFDEFGKMPVRLYNELLRAIDPNIREFSRLGCSKIRKFTGRVICAASEPLDEMLECTPPMFSREMFIRITEGGFIKMPPLRERKEDVVSLAYHLLKKICAKEVTKEKKLSNDAQELLIQYDWPGNIRELENALKQALTVSDQDELTSDDFPYFNRINIVSDQNKNSFGTSEVNFQLLPPDKFVINIKGKRKNLLLQKTGLDENMLREKIKLGLRLLYKEANGNVTVLSQMLDHSSSQYFYEYLRKWDLTLDDIKDSFSK